MNGDGVTTSVADVKPVRLEFGQIEREVSRVESRIRYVAEQQASLSKRLLQVYEASGCSVLSLDVFDTLLLRNDKSEAQRYFEIAERSADILQCGRSAEDVYLSRFLGMDISYRARREVDTCREGSLDEVLRSTKVQLGLTSQEVARLKEIEIEYEAENLVANGALVDLAETVRREGSKVILLSDMYLDGETISTLVKRVVGNAAFIDRVFSSADTIVSKRSGRIFSLVEESLERKPSDFFHLGDNRLSDVVRPVQAGWRAMHLPVSDQEEARRSQSLSERDARLERSGLDLRRWTKI